MRHRAALAGALTLAVAVGAGVAGTLGVGTTAPQPTQAAWVSTEAGSIQAAAGQVGEPVTSCKPDLWMEPNELTFAPADGLEVTGYRVDLTIDEGGDAAWQAGEGMLQPGEQVLDASTSRVQWGIASGYAHEWSGTVSVTALGPGGWESAPVRHDWTIRFDAFWQGAGTCT